MMNVSELFLISTSFLVSLFLLLKLVIDKQRSKHTNLAPSPPSLPIIGHLHLIKELPHRAFHQLSSKYGPILALRFGSRPVLVVSSPSAAEECFTTNDIVLANRPRFLSGKYLDYDATAMGSAPYGHLWRNLRRITTLELFSTTQLRAYSGVREEQVRSLIKSLFQDSRQIIEMKSRIQGMTFNIIMKIVADVEDFEAAVKFRDLIREIFELSGTSNPGDFIPILRWIDFQGLEKRLLKLHTKCDEFLQRLIEERRRKKLDFSSNAGKTKTFIDVMLCLQESEPEYYTDDIIKANILTLLLAGTDTSAVTIEWAMSLLLNHPDVLDRARAEVDECVGHKRLVDETDLPNLHCIQCIINETLRLFPPGPLLVPNESSEDCTIGGFDVSRGTIVLINAWGIHRDPKLWDEPLCFRPERFEKMKNEGYRFIPFGMGRRQCPGAGLANKVVGLALASMMQCFKWERVGQELIDFSEGKGITMPKKMPLEAMCIADQKMINVLREL